MNDLSREIHELVRTANVLEAGVLIVDDQDASVLLLSRLLVGAGYTNTASTTDPLSVLALHRANRYALILLDLKMPAMNGFEVMEQLQTLNSDGPLPVLVVTSEPGDKLRALRAGARDFVAKPLDLPEVLIRVRNAIEIELLHRKSIKINDELMRVQAANS